MSSTLSRRLTRRAGVALAGLVASTVVLLPSASHAAGTPSDLVLSATSTPAVSQSISFKASEPGALKGIVEYRPAGSTALKAVSTTTALRWAHAHHAATITGLSPATTYEYRVGSRLDLPSARFVYSGWKSFTTAQVGAADFGFITFGDTNEKAATDSRWPGIVTQARAAVPNAALTLHTGDMVQQTHTQSHWRAWIAGLGAGAATTNVLATVGENETADDFLGAFKAKLTNPANGLKGYEDASWYSDHQNVRFVSIDTTISAARVKEQAAWLKTVLTNNTSRWTVVSLHHGPFAVGRTTAEASTQAVRASVLPILTESDVDLVVSGHEGLYSRAVLSAKNAADGSNSGPLFVTNNSGGVDGTLAPVAASDLATNGGSALSLGEKLDTYTAVNVTAKGLQVSTKIAAQRPGAAAQRATWNGATHKWELHPVDPAKLANGAELDTVTVHKTADGEQKAVVEQGMPIPDYITNDTSAPEPGNPGTDNPTPGNPGTTPGTKPGGQVAGQSVTNRGKVTVKKVRVKAGKQLKLKVRSTVSGRVVIKVKHGKKTRTKKVTLKAGAWRTVTFKKKLAKVTNKKLKVIKVRTTLTPAKVKVSGVWTQPAKVTSKWRKLRVKK